MESGKEKREYIRQYVNPIIEPMVVEILVARPDDLVTLNSSSSVLTLDIRSHT